MNKFDMELAANIAKKIRELKRDGTTAMSLGNLLQVTPTPRTWEGAPAPAAYRDRFAKVVASEPAFKRFTY